MWKVNSCGKVIATNEVASQADLAKVAITDAGEQGMIALAACQAYVREVLR